MMITLILFADVFIACISIQQFAVMCNNFCWQTGTSWRQCRRFCTSGAINVLENLLDELIAG